MIGWFQRLRDDIELGRAARQFVQDLRRHNDHLNEFEIVPMGAHYNGVLTLVEERLGWRVDG